MKVMDVTELKNEGLKRRLKVVVPAADLETRLSARLADMAKNARIPGFRPGKVPVAHLRKLYGQQVMAEVLDEAVKDGINKALMERDERPAYQPEIDLEGDQEAVNDIINGKADLAFTMDYEITPGVEVKDIGGIELTRFKVAVPDEDIDEAVRSISGQFKDYEDKPEGATAEKGDRVVISFVGRVDGEEFEGGSAEDVPLEIGSGQFIPGFEDQLIGARAGEERIVKVTFPKEYGVESLAGKDAEFTVQVKSVETGIEPEINDAFAEKIGMKDLAELRDRVRNQAQAEMDGLSAQQLKRDVLDALDAQYDFELPERLVDSEFEQIWHTLEHQMKDEGRTFEDEGTTEEEARQEYRDIAARRVRLGLVLGTIGEQAGITVSDEEMQQALIDKARQFPGQEKEVIDYYRKNPEALIELRGPLFEGKVIEHIVEKAKVTEKQVSRAEIEKMLEEEDEGTKKPKAKKAARKPAKKSAKKPAKKTARKPAKGKTAARTAGGGKKPGASGKSGKKD